MTGFLLNNYMRWLLLIILTSCQSRVELSPSDTAINRTHTHQQEIDQLIDEDAENKRWARLYLQEIDRAIVNDDMVSYVFYVGEFEQIPLEIVPNHLRDEPGYVAGPSALELFFRLRWFEQSVIMFKQQSRETK
jgi:hypothetical protein